MGLIVGIPREIKPLEGRVALVPDAVADLIDRGVRVMVQRGAGELSGFSDDEYMEVGADIVPTAADVYGRAGLIVKVKEPIEGDLALLRREHLLFCFLHLAANPALTRRLADIGLTAIAFETVMVDGRLPLLAPMSEIAGRVAVQAGAHYLHASMGGQGVLLGGVAGTPKGLVVVLGAGVAGRNAAATAAAMGADVVVFDRNPEALRLAESLHPKIAGYYMSTNRLESLLPDTDLLVGAVLIPGRAAPRLVTRDMIRCMRPGTVAVDISIDQGGCIETMRPTDYRDPIFVEEGVIHMGVANLPGAVPRTSACALSGAISAWVVQLADGHLFRSPELHNAVNVRAGAVVHPALLQNP